MECVTCTACCTLLDVPWMDKKAGEQCRYCDNGCTIHETKDARCREFNCAYAQMEQVNIAMRPDKCGVIFEKVEDDIMVGTLDTNGTSFPFLQGQVKEFLKEGLNAVLIKGGQPTVYHQDTAEPTEILSRVYKIARKNNGNRSL